MNALERIIRPIVEGQIRGFLKEHPAIVDAVDWYNVPERDGAVTFVNSLSKRIVRDLTCGTQTARLCAALLELDHDVAAASAPAIRSERGGDAVGTGPDGIPGWLHPSFRSPQIKTISSTLRRQEAGR